MSSTLDPLTEILLEWLLLHKRCFCLSFITSMQDFCKNFPFLSYFWVPLTISIRNPISEICFLELNSILILHSLHFLT